MGWWIIYGLAIAIWFGLMWLIIGFMHEANRTPHRKADAIKRANRTY